MNPNTRRQLKDIQVHAERLINGRPTIEEIEEFDRYNEELKKYLLLNLEGPELLERARQLPRILEESNGQVAARGILSAVLAMFVSGLVTYFQDRARVENAMNSIQEAKGIYSTIEFFTRKAE